MSKLEEPFIGSDAIAAGVASKSNLRSRQFVRVFPNVYAPATLERTLELRSRAAYLYAREAGVLAGYSAACILGAECAPFEAEAEIAIPSGSLRSRPGLVVHCGAMQPDEIVWRQNMRITNPLRTAYDLARRCSRVEGVAAIDALARIGSFEPTDIMIIAARYPGARGSRRIPNCIALADPAAESAMESRLRVALVSRGIPRPVSQYSVSTPSGRFVARLDLAFPAARVGVEYEGRQHTSDSQLTRDVRRHNALSRIGWIVLRFTSADVLHRPDWVAAQVAAALAMAAAKAA